MSKECFQLHKAEGKRDFMRDAAVLISHVRFCENYCDVIVVDCNSHFL